MKLFVFDTNIVLHLVRGKKTSEPITDYLQNQKDAQFIVSVVSIAEAESIVRQVGNWSAQKVQKLQQLLQKFIVVDIEAGNTDLLESYTAIDAYSQGKIPAPNGQQLRISSRNMGKNDLWIAATAHTLDAVLLTADGDFDHLNNLFFEIKKF